MINYNRLINDAVLDSQLCCNQTLLQLINVPRWLLINTFLHHSLYFVFHRTGVRTVGRPQVWFDKIRGFVSQQLNGLTHTVCWRVVHAGKCKKSRCQCDGWPAATVWTARHYDNMHYSPSSVDPRKPNQCTRAELHGKARWTYSYNLCCLLPCKKNIKMVLCAWVYKNVKHA